MLQVLPVLTATFLIAREAIRKSKDDACFEAYCDTCYTDYIQLRYPFAMIIFLYLSLAQRLELYNSTLQTTLRFITGRPICFATRFSKDVL